MSPGRAVGKVRHPVGGLDQEVLPRELGGILHLQAWVSPPWGLVLLLTSIETLRTTCPGGPSIPMSGSILKLAVEVPMSPASRAVDFTV